MFKIRIVKILCVLILGSFVLGMGFEVRPLASEGLIVEKKDYSLTCENIKADINDFKSWTHQELLDKASCQLYANGERLGNSNLYIKENIDDINKSGIYELTVGITDSVYVNIELVLTGELLNIPSEKPIETNGAVKVDSEPDTSIDENKLYLNGKLYDIDRVEENDLWGEVIHFSLDDVAYIGLKDWGVYFKAQPNYLFLFITLLSIMVVIVYILVQNRDQKEYWGYRGDLK